MVYDVSLLLHKIQKNITYLKFAKQKYHDNLNEQKKKDSITYNDNACDIDILHR
jgi:hypothetical protein